jgi:hypothetical protein
MVRVVGSLTTIPGRYNKLKRTLKSLEAQDIKLDAIYLGIPERSRRLNTAYPELPDDIKELCTIVPCSHDYGPLTKIVGALQTEQDPDTIIITFDDDVIYSPNLVSVLLARHKEFPNSAIGSSGILLGYGFPFYSTVNNCSSNWNSLTGFRMTDKGRPVDILCGFSAVLYIRKFFPRRNKLHDTFLRLPLLDDDVYFNDDVMISAYLSAHNIERRIVPHVPPPNDGKLFDPEIDGFDGNEISFSKIAFLQRFRRAVIKVSEWGFFTTTQPVAMDETVAGVFLIVVIIIIILIMAVAMFSMS